MINTTSAKHNKKFNVKQPGDELAKLDSVSLAGTLDVRAIKTFIQDLFGIKHEKMTGEITAITVKDVTTYGVKIRLMPQDIVLVDLDEQLPIKDLIHLIALRIVEAKDPAVAASYHRRHHQDKESLRMIDKVLQDDDLTDDAYALTGRAHIYINQNKYKLAQEDLSRALKLDPQFPSALALQAQLFFRQKKFSEALAISKKEESLYPERWQTYMNLGESYAGLGDKAQAQANFLKVISKKPHSSRIFEEIADYFAKNGDIKRASVILSEGALLFPHDPSIFIEYAKILAEENKIEESKDALTKAYELDHTLEKLENEKSKTMAFDKEFIVKKIAEFAKAHSGLVKESVEDSIDNDLN
jgi:Flp pilus assembly protein TadD